MYIYMFFHLPIPSYCCANVPSSFIIFNHTQDIEFTSSSVSPSSPLRSSPSFFVTQKEFDQHHLPLFNHWILPSFSRWITSSPTNPNDVSGGFGPTIIRNNKFELRWVCSLVFLPFLRCEIYIWVRDRFEF